MTRPGADLEYQTGVQFTKSCFLTLCTHSVIFYRLKFFERGLGKTFFKKVFPIKSINS